MTAKIPTLLVEDDSMIRGLVCDELEQHGFEVKATSNRAEAELSYNSTTPKLILCDINLPDGSGFDFIRYVRRLEEEKELPATAILVMTARSADSDQVYGLDQGADDYLVKPFTFKVLLARVRSVLRRSVHAGLIAERSEGQRVEEINQHEDKRGAVAFDTDQNSIAVEGDPPAQLTRLEIDLLRYLYDQFPRTCSRQALVEDVWKKPANSSSGSVSVIVSRIRKRLATRGGLIKSVPGRGYRWQPPQKVLSPPH